MRVPPGLVVAVAILAACGVPEPDKPSMVVAPQMAREVARTVPGAYPLDTCVVSGEQLDSMGSPFVFVHEGTEVRLCCANCHKQFLADPEKHLAKIREARAGK